MAQRIRAMDWSATPLGPIDRWSPTLRATVRLMLANRFPHLLWWGPELIQLYNDAYIPVPGTKHPKALGQAGRECWPEIWHIIGPLVETPFNGGPATWMDDILLEIHRHGFLEETHFTIAYSPVPDEAAPRGIGGVLATIHETTQQVIQERRLAALGELGARSAEAKTAEEACGVVAEVLSRHAKDVPFALVYLVEADGSTARLAGAAGVERWRGIGAAGGVPRRGWRARMARRRGLPRRADGGRRGSRRAPLDHPAGTVVGPAAPGAGPAHPVERAAPPRRPPRLRRERAHRPGRGVRRLRRAGRRAGGHGDRERCAPTRRSGGARRRWPRSIGPRPRSSPT